MDQITAIISGAADGIGLSCLKKYLSEGADVFGLDIDVDKFSKIIKDTEHLPGSLTLLQVDLVRLEGYTPQDLGIPESACENIVLINNIGGSNPHKKKFEDFDWSDISASLEFNIRPTFTLMRTFLPYMQKQRWGRITNISSIAGRTALKNVGADYMTAKSALLGLSRKAAQEYGQYGILTNTVCPGIIATQRILSRWEYKTDDQKQQDLSVIPVNRLGEPDEVSELVYFLGSHLNTYTNGAVLDINGGLYMP